MKKPCFLLIAILVMANSSRADVKLPAIFSNHMVLEKTAKVPIWGKADPGEQVKVTLNGQTAETVAGSDGKWTTTLNLEGFAPGPFEMSVEGKNKIAIHDVLVGEVWLASGQSNMDWAVKNCLDADKVIAASANPLLREFHLKLGTAMTPKEDLEGQWIIADPNTTPWFSAVGYFFARKVQAEHGGPVGVILSSWGGTPSEAWTSVDAIDSVPDLKAGRERLWAQADEYDAKRQSFGVELEAWIKERGREDRAVNDVASYAGLEVPEDGWTAVKLPGPVKAPELTETGAVWLRKEIDIPAKNGAGLSLRLPVDGFDSVYWNGNLVQTVSYKDYPGVGFIRQWDKYYIPDNLIKPGKNVLAIRFYEPVKPAVFFEAPSAGEISLAGEWRGKTEYSLPEIDAETIAAAPKPPEYFYGRHNIPGTLFNAMINPLIPYAIKGVIWYQGESNGWRAYQYRTAFPLLIKDWRQRWQQGDFPFYFVQLANFEPKKNVPSDSPWAELREAQSMTLQLPNTGQAVAIDIGEANDVHPRNKKDVGERLAAIALARDYGKGIPYSGPMYESMKVENGKALLSFTHTDGGLVAKPLPDTYVLRSEANATAPLVRNSPDSELEGFVICGADQQWVFARAKIEGDKVVVWSDQVPAPVAVRYGWAQNPTVNLYNGAGFPASPFRTDDFTACTLNNKL